MNEYYFVSAGSHTAFSPCTGAAGIDEAPAAAISAAKPEYPPPVPVPTA